MTTEDFKKDRPEYAHLQGNDLWDAMTEVKLREQRAERILSQIKPFWKRYTLRYLFYVKRTNGVFVTPEASNDRCVSCKKGVSTFIGWGGKVICLCGAELIREPNTNASHYWYLAKKKAKKYFFAVLEFTHLVRYSYEGRYDTFGDEMHFVSRYVYDMNWKLLRVEMKPRKWWEYIIIEKR
jgi:hypothetical protein